MTTICARCGRPHTAADALCTPSSTSTGWPVAELDWDLVTRVKKRRLAVKQTIEKAASPAARTLPPVLRA